MKEYVNFYLVCIVEQKKGISCERCIHLASHSMWACERLDTFIHKPIARFIVTEFIKNPNEEFFFQYTSYS